MSLVSHADAFRISGTKGTGRGRSLTSQQAHAPGALIATFTDPLLVLPNGPSAKAVCNHCLAHHVPVKACTGCKAVVYCGGACQKANWGLVHRLECRVFKRVRSSVDRDWLPTPVRALVQVLLRWDADAGLRAAVGRLEGNVEGFRKREEVWKDIGLQAYGGMAYAGRKENDDELHMARDILCKVRDRREYSVCCEVHIWRTEDGTGQTTSGKQNVLIGRCRSKQILLTGPMQTQARLESSYIPPSPW